VAGRWLRQSKSFRISVGDAGNEALRRSTEPQEHLEDAVALGDLPVLEPRDRRLRDRARRSVPAVDLVGDRCPGQTARASLDVERIVQGAEIEVSSNGQGAQLQLWTVSLDQVLILGVLLEKRAHVGAFDLDAQAVRARVIQRRARELAGNAMAPLRRRNLGVEQNDGRWPTHVVDQFGQPPIGSAQLEAVSCFVVLDGRRPVKATRAIRFDDAHRWLGMEHSRITCLDAQG